MATGTNPMLHERRSGPKSIAAWLAGSALKVIVAVAALALAFWLGAKVASHRATMLTAPSPAAETVDHWTCSMHPEVRQSEPGQCPICGMDLIPVPKSQPASAAKTVKYACAMMCIPPVEHAGECPVCGMQMVPVQEHGDARPDGSLGSNVLSETTLSPAAQRLAKIEVAPVERRFVSAEIRMVGKVAYDETRQRTISSRVPGRLDRLFVDYTGVPVREGDHLVSLYSPELLAAQRELIESLNSARGAQPSASQDVRRIREESVEAARQKLLLWGLTEDQVQEIENRGTPSDHMTIYAPIGGIVTEKRLVEGAYVETGTEIYTIADLSHLWVKLDAYESDLAWLRYGQVVEFTTEAYPGDVFRGTIAFIDPVLNAQTRTAKVRVNVANDDGRLKPEMFVRAIARSRLTAEGRVMDPELAGRWICPMHPEVIAEGPDSCTACGMPLVPVESLGYVSASPQEAHPPLVIPASAPLITGPRAILYVAKPDDPGRFEGREVVLGARAGDYYLVREGLSEGEQVVVHGNLYLDSAVQILAKRSMMSPEPMQAASPGHAHTAASPQTPKADETHEALAAPSPLTNEARRALDEVYTRYLAVHLALSRDRLDEARTAAADLKTAAGAMSGIGLDSQAAEIWKSVAPGLQKSADATALASEMAVARAAFEGVSNALIAVARGIGPGSRERIHVYHCPMAFDDRGAAWLQEKTGVENPYFGSVMFSCGLLKESIARPVAGGAP